MKLAFISIILILVFIAIVLWIDQAFAGKIEVVPFEAPDKIIDKRFETGKVYLCPICKKYYHESMMVCAVLHPLGDCCHYHERRSTYEEYTPTIDFDYEPLEYEPSKSR